MSDLPWSKFFWSDYDADEGLRMCSLAAQGLWMRMLCLMARANPKGELRVGGEPCTASDLSRVTGETEATIAALLGELEKRGVFSRTRAGVIFSRRMRKDAEISRKRAKSGAKGAAVTNGKHAENHVCRSKNPANVAAKERPQKPEARSHMPEANNLASFPSSARDGSPSNDPSDFEHRCRSVAQEIDLIRPIAQADRDVMRAWIMDGLHFENHILEGVKRVAAREKGRGHTIRSFKYLDQGVREYHDEWLRDLERYRAGAA